MNNNDILRPIQSREREAHRLRLFSGMMYGLVFGLSFAAVTWGYDGYVLASNRATYAWTKLALGLPLALIIGGLTGRRTSGTRRRRDTGRFPHWAGTSIDLWCRADCV